VIPPFWPVVSPGRGAFQFLCRAKSTVLESQRDSVSKPRVGRISEQWLGCPIPTGLCPSAQGCPDLSGLPWAHPAGGTTPTVLWPGSWVRGKGTATTALRLVTFGNGAPKVARTSQAIYHFILLIPARKVSMFFTNLNSLYNFLQPTVLFRV
jgi:hypothetical protein